MVVNALEKTGESTAAALDYKDQKQLVERFIYDVVAKGDLTLIDELIHPNYVRHDSVLEKRTSGICNCVLERSPADVKENVVEHQEISRDISFSIDEMIVEKDTVAVRMSSTATMVDTEEVVSGTGMAICRIADGKIAEVWSSWDRPDAIKDK